MIHVRQSWHPTKRLISLLALVFAGIAMARADSPAPLATIGAIRMLSLAEARQGHEVAVEGTVTFFQPAAKLLFLQSGDDGVLVQTQPGASNPTPGDRVLIRGVTSAGYRPYIRARAIEILGPGKLMRPVAAGFDELIEGSFNARLISVRGVVQSADRDAAGPGATLTLRTDGGTVEARLLSADPRQLESLLDAEVEATGVADGSFDGKMELTGVVLHVGGLSAIRTLKPAAIEPWTLPATQMNDILAAYRENRLTHRVRVSGTVTYTQPGSMLVLQNGEDSLRIRTASRTALKIGDRADAIGFPAVEQGMPLLETSEVRDSGTAAPIHPAVVTGQELALGEHVFDLISVEGRLVMQARKTSQDEYILVTGGHVFSAIFPHSDSDGAVPMTAFPIGARMRIVGISLPDDNGPLGRAGPLNIMIRSPGDLVILEKPSLFTARNLGIFSVLLLLGMVGFGARAWFIDRKVRTQLAELGYLTQRRGEILEAINRRRPLMEILERITELASFTMKGAPCWCELAEGDRLGNRPQDASGLRTAEFRIAGRSGGTLGSISAAFDARTTPQPDEEKALASAAELAKLAIETSRLHSDLVHRSEFDMLTEIQNRFSFERHLDNMIETAQRNNGAFGVVFIDLDDFKLVNDRYGHQFGDAYLQHVADRMKNQLRPGDLLARLGGDEFGILVSSVQHRSDAEEIVGRLRGCFREPFAIGSAIIKGSASIGFGLYPVDATTKDNLLSSADAAMYAEKHSRHEGGAEFLSAAAERAQSMPRAQRMFRSVS